MDKVFVCFPFVSVDLTTSKLNPRQFILSVPHYSPTLETGFQRQPLELQIGSGGTCKAKNNTTVDSTLLITTNLQRKSD